MRGASAGHKLGSSILDTEPKWRCEVCTFINRMVAERCGRCREPVDEDDRKRLKLRVEKPAPKASAAPKAAPAARRTTPSRGREGTASRPAGFSARPEGQRSSGAGPKKGGKVHTVGGDKKSSTVRRTHFGGMHKGDLGYKPSKGGNVKGVTRSRLNEATASYAAKFEKEGDGKKPRSGNIHTIGSGQVNGFTKSSAATKAEQVRREHRNPHDEKRAPVPAKYRTGGLGAAKGTGKRQTGLLARLQAAAGSAAVASLKHTKRTVQPSVKTTNGAATKFAL